MAIVIGLVLALGLGGFLYLDRAAKKPPPAPPPLTGPARAYARYLKLMNVEMKAHESRSEERRAGKECRSRGSPYHLKKSGIGFLALLTYFGQGYLDSWHGVATLFL